MSTLPGAVTWEVGDTNPGTAPSANTQIKVFPKAGALPATVSNTQIYLQDSTGAVALFSGLPISFLKAQYNVSLASGQLVVNFAGLSMTNEPNTSYVIMLSCAADEVLHWTTKATTGFTIVSSNGLSTATIDWMTMRLA